MKIKCPHTKLENTILDLNHKGYIVISSEIQGQEYILRIKKIEQRSFQDITKKNGE